MHVPLGEVVAAIGPTVAPDETAQEALALLSATGAPEACVIADDGRFLGLVTDYELLKAALNGSLAELQVHELMHRRPQTLSAEQTLADAARLFRDGGLSRVPILSDGRVVGLVRRGDVLKWIAKQTPASATSAVPAPRFLTTSGANREAASVI
jgi:CBS domain-containing protein